MKDLAVSVNLKNKGVTPKETMLAIKKAGFKKIFISWTDYRCESGKIITKEEQLNMAKKIGLNVINVHLIYNKTFIMWQEDETQEWAEKKKSFKNDIDQLAKTDIKLAIMHINGGYEQTANITRTGLKRLGELLEYANSKNITIAMENPNDHPAGYLDVAMDTYNNLDIGLCFDSGHANCNRYGKNFNYDLFKDRVYAVHLHDNMGRQENTNGKDRDEHLLPLEGTVDWHKRLKTLKEIGYKGPITLELCYKEPYLKLSLDEFYKKAYLAAVELRNIADRITLIK